MNDHNISSILTYNLYYALSFLYINLCRINMSVHHFLNIPLHNQYHHSLIIVFKMTIANLSSLPVAIIRMQCLSYRNRSHHL